MEYYKDTIAAIATPAGKGGLHIIRVSGDDSLSVVHNIFRGRDIRKSESHRVYFGKIYDGEELLDEVLITVFRDSRSYTGENVVEISCHGNQFLAERILELLLRSVRLAAPGEFTSRAFLNNKLDLTQAEAVGDLLTAETIATHRMAINQLEGKLAGKISELVEKLTRIRILLELNIDFSEDIEEDLDLGIIDGELSEIAKVLEKLADSSREGIILRKGYKISLAGRPNVGKSSIFNKFLETERAIVTPVPGTTRDYLEESFSLQGILVRLFDTAGMRKTDNEVEIIGINRSLDIFKQADLLIYISDGCSDDDLDKFYDLLPEINMIKVLNKCDILPDTVKNKYEKEGYIFCSAVNEAGMQKLKEAILQRVNIDPSAIPETLLNNGRQLSAVKKALQNIGQARESIHSGLSVEFIAFDIQEASRNLEDITGVVTTDEILNRIFSDFCIGK